MPAGRWPGRHACSRNAQESGTEQVTAIPAEPTATPLPHISGSGGGVISRVLRVADGLWVFVLAVRAAQIDLAAGADDAIAIGLDPGCQDAVRLADCTVARSLSGGGAMHADFLLNVRSVVCQ